MRLLCWPRVRSSTAAPVVTVRVCFSVAVVMIFVGAADNRAEPRDKVLLRVQVPSTLDSSVEDDDDWQDGQLSAAKTSIAQLTCKLFASFSGTETISNLLISVKVPDAVTTKQTTIVIPTLGTCGMVQCAVARGVLRPGPWWVPSVSPLTRALCCVSYRVRFWCAWLATVGVVQPAVRARPLSSPSCFAASRRECPVTCE